MKKIFIAILLLGSFCVNAFAQNVDDTNVSNEFKHNEVYLSGGTSSLIGAFSGFFVLLGESFRDAIAENKEENGPSSLSSEPAFGLTAGYNYFFNKYFGLGGMMSYERFINVNMMSVQAKFIGQYGWTHFKIYQSASAGLLVIPEVGATNFIFDFTYLGMKLDFDHFNIFIEGSVPSTSLIKVGAAFKF